MDSKIFKGKLSYDDYMNIFFVTIIFSTFGIFIAVFTENLGLFLNILIAGVLIDGLKFAAKVFVSIQSPDNIEDTEK
ncbi:hypothetical protein [Ornithinibacillus halophilus]|uniref:YrhK-like protein n=1 Tax=Ornithinibacillus halophilus TaxID=930117 RepID=A0A1M5JXJ9_9BACI|nr:hypothetical protein [Ornithinibacillus halophilus]SHG45302.1 hypothetical protein SAMN05216225_103415 [Ornithinibacillus halophilus]